MPSAIDTLFENVGTGKLLITTELIVTAWKELAQLSAAAAEADALRAEREQWRKDFSALMDQISHLDDVLNDTDECEAWSGCADVVEQFDPWESIRVMVETAKTLRATVAEQARKLEQAYKILNELSRISVDGIELLCEQRQNINSWCDAYLAANAPTPGETESEK